MLSPLGLFTREESQQKSHVVVVFLFSFSGFQSLEENEWNRLPQTDMLLLLLLLLSDTNDRSGCQHELKKNKQITKRVVIFFLFSLLCCCCCP